MANEDLTKKILDEVLGDPAKVFTALDPIKALDSTMPAWMTEDVLNVKPQ